MKKTDYCGLMAGKKTGKASLFDLFYGELKTAPMIRQWPVNMELALHRVIDFPTHDVFVGEIVNTYADGSVVSVGNIDITKVKPLLFNMASKKYWVLSKAVGNCWNAGKALKKINNRF